MAFTYTWQWHLQSSPERLWPLVSDTDRFNALAGVPAVEIADDESVEAPTHLLRMRIFGQTIEWEEPPFEWVSPHWFRIVRTYRRGPVARMVVTLRLAPTQEGGSLLTYTVEAEPANPLGYLAIPIQIGLISRVRFERAFRLLDDLAQRAAETPQRAPLPARTKVRAPDLLDTLAARLVELGFDAALVERLKTLIRTGTDAELAHMHPILYARRWQADEQSVINLFFHASRVGLLELQWDVACPACHGTPVSLNELRQLEEHAHCPYCRIVYEADFEHAVQVTFRPHPTVREVVVPVYCVGGPRNTPHLLAQQWLAPGETRTIEIDLEAGEYRLRWPTHPDWREAIHSFEEWQTPRPWQSRLIVSPPDEHAPSPRTQANFVLAAALNPAHIHLDEGRVTLTITNRDTQPHLIGIERLHWADYTLTAARALTLQSFRDLFPFESLRKGMQIHVSSVALLFTDLRGSTAYYRQVGDGPAFDRVAAHFDILRRNVEAVGGAVVKTIGDAIMGAFPNLEMGLQAALGILQDIEAYNASHTDWPLRLRLGLNSGPALVVTLNGQLDYFGSTVNLAAKLERQSRGNEIVLPHALFDTLETPLDGWCTENDMVAIPGEEKPFPIVRIWKPTNAELR
ncbi:hypothetical protein ARMA_1070 [Ardenticatena maritima]|uniref:Guanylate cyclase domain-containing protein n=1 Tax=Ardenticatena maritima TaxID=872965 RepID=A0A0M9UCB2_9CHLR|nr:DUF5939 domain-containing protein [Ardenticatena maritima]KPL89469.1 hypothetical protein SE16_03255 [Ardenticatena maritima]GAP62647.1 hypothetical protein ARMA_1070 [Ardenticatena maritima]